MERHRAGILTVSDRCSSCQRKDESGEIIREFLLENGFEVVRYEIVPDEEKIIGDKLLEFSDRLNLDVVLTTGGTGLGPRDVTPEVTREVLEKEIPGIPEAMRRHGLKYTPHALLSRSVAGLRGKTLIINLPGSPRGVRESLEILKDILTHALEMIQGRGH